jgi:hypothetical protein
MGSNDLPMKKIYIDSKFGRHDSVSSSNFKIELPYTLKLPDNAIFYVDDVCIPHNWYTVEAGVNDKLYIRTWLLGSFGANTDYILTLIARNYTPASFQIALTVRLGTLMDALGSALVPTVSHDPHTNTLGISIAGHECKIMSDAELTTVSDWGVAQVPYPHYDVNNLASVNDLLTNTGKVSTTGTAIYPAQYYLSLQPVRNIYMRSPNISSFNTIGCNGESSVIKKIPVSSNQGDMIFNNITSANDFLDCSKATWKTLEFHLVDVNSKYINLHGADVSFSLILDKQLPDQ